MSGTRYALATPHRLATEAGVAAFEDGGTALDAAVAAAAALTVVYPHNCALGGDVIALVATPDGVVTVNGSGAAAAAESADDLRPLGDMPASGPRTVTVPGAIAGWEALLSLGSQRSLADALAAAIAYAENGAPVARSLAAAIDEFRVELAADPGAAGIFLDDGAPRAEGSTLRQPALARTLRNLADEGACAFYRGELGASLVATLHALGSKLTTADFAAHETELALPLSRPFGEFEILTAPPNSQGFLLLEILCALDAHPELLDPARLARLIAVATADRDRHLADPRFTRIPLDELLSPDHADELAARADFARAPAAPAASGDTIAVVAADADYAVSLIQSVFAGFGARILDPETGILCHNRGASFSLDERSPNCLAGGKRPAHTLMPVLIRRDGEVIGANGTMGGHAQAQIHTQLLLAARTGATPQEAVRAPRWTVGTVDEPDDRTVLAERDVAAETLTALEAAGFTVELVPELDERVGHAQALTRIDGRFLAGSDPRADGSAVTG
ncbi:MAG: gamma-glutamyltransferase family protein [Gaiellaceae bacterium]